MPYPHDQHATYLEYAGHCDATPPCEEAVERLLASRRTISKCLILTCRGKNRHGSHALMLTDAVGDVVMVKSGFSSGYGGTGPKGFSATIGLLNWHGVDIDEIEVPSEVLDRLDASALTVDDVALIGAASPIRPSAFWEYAFDDDLTIADRGNPWSNREPVVPLAILDERLAVLARDFWEDPDHVLTRAHRKLEEMVKAKAGITQEEANGGPSKVYSAAFNPGGRLQWPGLTSSEQAGRAALFVGTVAAYRNPRAHRELRDRPQDALRELLLLNHLFCLEAESESRVESVV